MKNLIFQTGKNNVRIEIYKQRNDVMKYINLYFNYIRIRQSFTYDKYDTYDMICLYIYIYIYIYKT